VVDLALHILELLMLAVVAEVLLNLLVALAVLAEAVLETVTAQAPQLQERQTQAVVAVVVLWGQMALMQEQQAVQEFLLSATQRYRWTNGTLGRIRF
jgi:hypothetical protein